MPKMATAVNAGKPNKAVSFRPKCVLSPLKQEVDQLVPRNLFIAPQKFKHIVIRVTFCCYCTG